jgi:hypothetical protein
MSTSLRSAALLVIAVAVGWMLRGGIRSTPVPAAPVAATPVAISDAPPPAEVPFVLHARAPQVASSSGRNLFAFRERPYTPPPAVAPPVIVVAAAPPVVQVEPQNHSPAPKPFPYRFIGRFGPERNPVAAFVRDGEVVTVRPGDRIGDGFTLRSIGIESAEIENETAQRQHVPLQSASV